MLAAGGTGGHLFPAEALALELTARGWTVHLVTDERAERYAGNFPAAGIHRVASATIGSKNPLALLRAGLTIWKGAKQSTVLINRLKPAIVVGFGGYPTLPPLWAATRRGVSTLIHEQNAVMGRANRALAARVSAIAGGFLAAEGTHAGKIVETGNPVRPAVIEAARQPYAPFRGGDAVFNLLVFGGSQGARFFGDTLPDALALLPERERTAIRLTLQARPDEESEVKRRCAEIGLTAEVAPFFDDLAARMAAAHLVIARAGASTVSEIGAIGRPALLVPYPYALDHDQAANAAALERQGGAIVHPQSELSPERLAGLIGGFMRAPDDLAAMATKARAAGRPDAARLLADLAEAIASGQTADAFKRKAQP